MANPYWSDFVPNPTFYRILRGFHRTMATGVACWQGTLTLPDTWSCPIWDLQMFFCWDHWHSIIHYITNSGVFTWFDFLPNLTPFLDLTPPIHVPFPDLTHLILNLTWLDIGFHWAFATGVACRQGTLTPPGTWSRSFGTCMCSTCWDQSFFRTCRYFSRLCSSNIPRYFLDFSLMTYKW